MIIFSHTGDPKYDPDDIVRVIHFPQNRVLGMLEFIGNSELYHISSDSSGSAATGDVPVPRDTKVHLRINNSGCTDLSGLSQLQPDDLDRIDFFECAMEDFQLKHLQHLTGLKQISFYRSKVSEFGIALLGKLKWLELLSFDLCDVDDLSMEHIGKLNLRYLYLSSTAVTNAGLAEIGDMPNLKHLSLPKWITDEGLAHLSKLKLDCLYAETTQCSDEAFDELEKSGVAGKTYRPHKKNPQ